MPGTGSGSSARLLLTGDEVEPHAAARQHRGSEDCGQAEAQTESDVSRDGGASVSHNILSLCWVLITICIYTCLHIHMLIHIC